MSHAVARTAEHVSAGHPDKFCDQVADRILDRVLQLAKGDEATLRGIRTAIECLAKDNLLVVSGEVKLTDEIRMQLDIVHLARDVWYGIGYGPDPEVLTVIDHIRNQSPDIAHGAGSGTDAGGAGDQGVMVGYATAENPEMVPPEWLQARNLIMRLHELRRPDGLAWLRSDCKTQVSLDAQGNITSVIIAAQHSDEIEPADVDAAIFKHVVIPVLGNLRPDQVTINGTGKFVIGGPTGDAGVVGRKIVVDAYGPEVPVGGGAYSGKDPSKVDRSAAYMARHIAKTVVAHQVGGAKECTVRLAYGIGKHQPEMVAAITESGKDVSSWVREKFPDLSPRAIIDQLQLLYPNGWSYFQSASHGHYGRDIFPWEKIANV